MKEEKEVGVEDRSTGTRFVRICAALMVVVLIGVAAVSFTASAASTATKPDLGGYTGSDAQYVINQLPDPVIKPGYKFKVGFLQVFSGVNVLMTIQTECEKKVKALGGTFIAYDGGLDIQKQVSQMDQLIAQKVDVIIAYPVTEAGLTQGIAAAKKAGIPTVLISTPSNSKQPLDPNAAAMVGMAFDQYGYSTMKYIAKKYPHAKVAFVGFGPPNENLTHIVGSAKYWAKEMGLNVLGQVDALDPSPNATTVATQAILGKYPDVQIIVGYNDYTAMAAAAAVRASGKTGILVATPNGGQDITAAAMKNGSALTAYRNPWEKLGNTAAIAAYDILTKQNLPAKRMLLIGESATQENVSSLTFVH